MGERKHKPEVKEHEVSERGKAKESKEHTKVEAKVTEAENTRETFNSEYRSIERHKVSHFKRNISLLVLVIVIIFSISFVLQIIQRVAVLDLQIKSISVVPTGLSFSGVSLELNSVVYNPNPITATIDQISYSVYENNNFVGDGQISSVYNIPADSSYVVSFPISIGWGSLGSTIINYIVSGGKVTWSIHGSDNVNIDGIKFSLPFNS